MIETLAIAGATLVSVAAFVVSLFSLQIQKESARAATVSAEAAQRANVLTEQRLQRELEHDRDHPPESGPAPESGTAPEPGAAPGGYAGPAPQGSSAGAPHGADRTSVRWTLDRRGRNGFVLRNTGSTIAEEVRIPAEALPPIARNLPESATLRPNESVEFLMKGTIGHPVPNEIPVIWKNNPSGVLVPVPGN